jgi:hypothetical protein
VAVVPVAVEYDCGVAATTAWAINADIVGSHLVFRRQPPSGNQVDSGGCVVTDQDVQSVIAEPVDIGCRCDLVQPPVAPEGAVTPVNGEGSTEEADDPVTDVDTGATRQIGDMVGNQDRRVSVLQQAERVVVVVVAVDEPQFDVRTRSDRTEGL